MATLLQKLKDSGMMAKPDATSKRMGGGGVLSCHEFYYDKLGIDLLNVTLYWEAERGRHKGSPGDIEAENKSHSLQNTTNLHPSTTSPSQGDSTVSFGHKPLNQPENDDTPF